MRNAGGKIRYALIIAQWAGAALTACDVGDKVSLAMTITPGTRCG